MYIGNLSRFANSYYVVNALTLISYLLVRNLFSESQVMMFVPDGFMGLTREQEIGAMALLYIGARARKFGTLDEIVGTAILVGKIAVVAWSWYLDLRAMTWYLIAFLVLFLVVKRPQHRMDSSVTALSPATFDSVVRQGEDGVAWLVFFYARWSDRCVNLQPVLSEIASRFSTRGLKFASVDLAQWPEVGNQHSIDSSGISWQLPTFVLFENGSEQRRLPQVKPDGTVDKLMIDRNGLIAFFELERRMLAARAGRAPGAAAQPAAAAAVEPEGRRSGPSRSKKDK